MAKKQNKERINIVFISFILIIVLVILFIIFNPFNKKEEIVTKDNLLLIANENTEDYTDPYNNRLTTSYDELDDFIKEKKLIKEEDYKDSNYYIFEVNYDPNNELDVNVKGYNIKDNIINVTVEYKRASCGVLAPAYAHSYYAIKLNKDEKINKLEITNNEVSGKKCRTDVEYKPIIYIYPENEMEVSIKLGNEKFITTSYPKYNNGWKALASPNGNLKIDERNYYGLYWEGKNHISKELDTGFVIKGEDTSKFLEEKLSILGLNEREINEFIIYWLPKMEKNNYNYIRFESKEEIDSYMPLIIEPTPDKIIRVYMEYKSLNEYKEVKEQILTKENRKGYTVVEWGGSIIEN